MERKETSFKGYIISAVVVALVVVSLYFYQFRVYPLSIDNTDWGTFGDFVGGTLNPFFAFMAFLALLTTIKIQSNELELTREELAKSSLALESQSESFKIQNDSIKQQNFENTFFNMLNLHNEIMVALKIKEKGLPIKGKLNGMDISFNRHIYNETNNKLGKDAICEVLGIFNRFLIDFNTYPNYENSSMSKFNDEEYKDYKLHPKQCNRTNELYLMFHDNLQQVFGHYFRNIYQILKFISNSSIENKKFYANIFRAQFSKDELELLFYNCASDIGNEKFLPLIIEFEFLEHLPFREDINKKDIAYCVSKTKELNSEYHVSKLFGASKYWEDAIK
jgi:hypothetical protein